MSIRVSILTRVYPMCNHDTCYGNNSCLCPVDITVSAAVDLDSWSVSDLQLSEDVALAAGDRLILRDELCEEAERILSLCPACEGGVTAGALCKACEESAGQDEEAHQLMHSAGSLW